jgi:endonuclease/exonuclease/phosphatase family metal-dependent hydrolase
MTTHLEFHSEFQRCEQVRRIVSINQEINNLVTMPPLFDNNGSYRKFERSDRVILCGDFNFNPGSVEYNLLTSNEINSNFFLDAWKQLNPNSSHSPTCGIFDKKQWPEGPHCRDFGFISSNLERSLNSIEVNENIDASDHQPVILTFS